jgi:hypothetical protein
MDLVDSTVKFIRSRGLKQRQCRIFLIHTEHRSFHVPHQTAVWCLSHSEVPSTYFALSLSLSLSLSRPSPPQKKT